MNGGFRLAGCLLVAALLPGQERQQFEPPEGSATTVTALVVPGTRMGGHGFVLVEARNDDPVAHRIRVGYAANDWSGGNVEAEREAVVGSQELARWFLPLPTAPDCSATLSARIDGHESKLQATLAEGDGIAAVLVTERPGERARAETFLAAQTGGDKASMRVLPPADLPADWTLWSTFDVVLVDPSAALAGELQEALRRYATAGGVVVVASPAAMPAGPLRHALDQQGGDERLGFGAVYGVASWRNPAELPRLADRLGRTTAGPAPPSMHAPVQIPGLGEVPVRAFLVVILLFAILAGPVNLIVLRRRRQPLLTLVTVPAMGLGTTLAILGYGMFHDGFGIRGVLHSVSLLDQRTHEATAFAARTLFAGLAPSRLELPAGAMVECLEALIVDWQQRRPQRLIFAGDGVLDGGALPSRTRTTLVTCQQGPARARLRFQQRADGGLDLLADAGFELTAGSKLLVRLFDGRYFEWRGGLLEQRPGRNPQQFGDSLRTGLLPAAAGEPLQLEYRGRGRSGHSGGLSHVSADQLPAELEPVLARLLLPGGELPPGSYLAQPDRAPWLCDLGLTVAVEAERHCVFGRLAEEDVIR